MVQARSKKKNGFLTADSLIVGFYIGLGLTSPFLLTLVSVSNWDTTDLISCVRDEAKTVSCIHQESQILWQQSKTREFKLQSVDVVEETESNSDGGSLINYELYLKTDSDSIVVPIKAGEYHHDWEKANKAKNQFNSLWSGFNAFWFGEREDLQKKEANKAKNQFDALLSGERDTKLEIEYGAGATKGLCSGILLMILLTYILLVMLVAGLVALVAGVCLLLYPLYFLYFSINFCIRVIYLQCKNLYRYSSSILWNIGRYFSGDLYMYSFAGRIVKVTENQRYLFGVGAGLSLFIFMLGWRLIVVLTGGAIAFISIVYWFWKKQSPPDTQAPSANLLQADIFLDHLACFQKQIPATRFEVWAVTQTQACSIQTNAEQIALRESVLIPDLLETLHSTLDLTEQIAEALHLLDQMQTPQYQIRIQQRLQESLERLQATQTQLQTLNDQFAYERLEQRSHYTSALAAGLRILVSENEQVCK